MSQMQLQVHPKASFSGFMGGVLGAVDSWTRGGVYVRVRWAWGPLSDQVWEAYSIAALFRCSYLPSYVTPSSSPTHLHIDMSQKKIFLLMHHHVHFLSHHCPSIQWVSNDEIRSDTFNSTLVVFVTKVALVERLPFAYFKFSNFQPSSQFSEVHSNTEQH